MTLRAGSVDQDGIQRALCGPAGLYVEEGCPPPRGCLPLRLRVRTRTAHAYPLAAAFTLALRERAGLTEALAEAIELALHEAVLNAVVHGNLGIGSEDRDTSDGLARYCASVSAGLGDPRRGTRLVDVSAWWSSRWVLVAVADEGLGFRPETLREPGELAYGRGLPIMRSLADHVVWNQRRRRLLLRFRRGGGKIAAPSLRPELAGCRIAVVDDALTNRLVIAASLRQAGFSQVLTAEDGVRGLELVRSEAPDLVLLDLLMPGLDGFEVAVALRADPRFADLPILCMTGLEDAGERARAFAAGASDLILKPIHQAELLARTTTHLERRLLIRGLRDFQERTGAELAVASAMQQALLPGPAVLDRIAERQGIVAAAVLTPSAELGGDLWGIWPIDAARVGVFVLDVSGHGTIAAINTFRLHTLLAEEALDRTAPGAFLAAVNDRLTDLLPRGHFATMFYGVLDTGQSCLTYAAAGCPDPLLAAPGGPSRPLDGSGVPLGIERGMVYPEREAPFGRGARLLLYSDALPEALLPDGSRLGERAARAMIDGAFRHQAVPDVVADLGGRIASTLVGGLDDDLTLVCLGR